MTHQEWAAVVRIFGRVFMRRSRGVSTTDKLREELAAAKDTAAKWEHACDYQRERAESAEQREREARRHLLIAADAADAFYDAYTGSDPNKHINWSIELLRLRDKARAELDEARAREQENNSAVGGE